MTYRGGRIGGRRLEDLERGLEKLHGEVDDRLPNEPGEGHDHSRDHLALLYESREEQFDTVVPFVSEGLQRGEHCLYIAADSSRTEVLQRLRDGGVDVDAALESGALDVRTAEETYLDGGYFDVEDSLALLEESIARAAADFEGFRVTVEESWLLEEERSVEEFMALESRVNELFQEEDCVALCQYDRSRFPPEVIREVIRTHPHLVHDDRVNENVYYAPPAEYLGADPATEVDRKLRTVQERTRTKEDHQRVVEALEAAREGIALLDDEGAFSYVNDAYAETFGYDPDEMIGAHWDALGIEADPDYVYEEVLPAVEAEGQWTGTTTSVRSDGSTFLAQHSLTLTEDGELICVLRDVTERREREKDLQRALDLLERTERIADVGGWEIDPETREVFWTDHLFDLLGVHRDEEPALEDALEMYHDEDRPAVEAAVDAALETGDPFDVEARIHIDDGEVRWLRLQGVPETDAAGEVVSLRGAAQDVTERKRRERRLEDLIERLEESNERLEHFAYAASHDLQEPLRMVSSYLRLLERRYGDALDDDGEEFIGYAVDGADRMREMIDGLLAYSRVETRGEPLEPVDLEAVLEDVRSDLQLQIEESGAEIAAGDLPTVEGDASQLRQVLQNLLENAIEYSGDAPPRIEIFAERATADHDSPTAATDGGEWVVSVADDGIGIDPEDADRVFQVFERLHSREDHPGTGIGLALCERIVERHGGDIWVESEPGEGSTFRFRLPGVPGQDG